MLQALLRKGADPNVAILTEGSRGNTPLHFACLLEKHKHADLLLQYGANPFMKNEYDQHPLQLVPKDTVRSTKTFFKKIFEEAYNKVKTTSSGTSRGGAEL